MSDEQKHDCPDQADLKEGQDQAPTGPPGWALARPELIQRLESRPGRLRLALTGGAASGKSRVAALLTTLGAREVDLDNLCRQVSAPGTAGFQAMAEILGPEYIAGALNRAEIGRIVFADHEIRRRLEDALHPLIWEALDREMAALGDEAAVAVSVPLLFETGLHTLFSPIIMVFAGPAAQIFRLLTRRPGLSQAEAEQIVEAQWPAAPKIKGSHFVINNDGEWEATERQVRALWPRLLAGA